MLRVDIVVIQFQMPAFLRRQQKNMKKKKKKKKKIYLKDICQSLTWLPVSPGSVGSGWRTVGDYRDEEQPLGLETGALLIVLFPLCLFMMHS